MSTLDRLITSFVIDMRGRHLAPKTVSTYERAARDLAKWLADQGITDGSQVGREQLSSYFAHLASFRTPGGVSVDFRALQQFFKWADQVEDEITPNPMARMSRIEVPDPETRVLRLEEIKRLLKVCDGKDFMSRRDKAMISLLLDTGIRRSELAGLEVDQVSLEAREAYVMGKGRRARIVPFGHQTARSLDRYLRAREGHSKASLPGLWLGERSSVMTADGIDQMLRRRGLEAGISDLHLHVFRHTFAHNSKEVLHDDELMRLAGWKSRQMLTRYAASTADERAREAGKKYALLDRL